MAWVTSVRSVESHWPRTAARLAGPVLLLVLSLNAAARILLPLPPHLATIDPLPWHITMAVYGLVGVIIVTRRPTNLVGWLFVTVGVFDNVAAAVRSLAVGDLSGIASIPYADVAAWVQAWIWAPGLAALALLTWVFPTGRPLPGRWRWGTATSLLAALVLLVPVPVLLWPLRGPALLFDEQPPGAAGIVTNGAFFALMLSAALGVVSLMVRLRRSRGDERQQLKWFVYASAVTMVQAFTDILVLDALGVGESMAREVASALALLVIPVAAAIAMLKYRLYDIDRLINRTVVYGALTAALGVAYLAVVAVVSPLTSELTGDTNVAVAASTLAVAALFRPARQRIQAAVDRRFNRARYDAEQTVVQFSSRLRDEVELETLAAELCSVVGATMQPARTVLWLSDAHAP